MQGKTIFIYSPVAPPNGVVTANKILATTEMFIVLCVYATFGVQTGAVLGLRGIWGEFLSPRRSIGCRENDQRVHMGPFTSKLG